MTSTLGDCLRLYLAGDRAGSRACLLDSLSRDEQNLDARLLLVLLTMSALIDRDSAEFLESLALGRTRSADEYERIGEVLRKAGLEELARASFRLAAEVDLVVHASEHEWGWHPFNGQRPRADLFLRLARRLQFEVVIETGTFRGTTTKFMHDSTEAQIFSCETNDRYFEYARGRLQGLPRIHLSREDSREYLQQLVHDERVRGRRAFVYLDAHWGADLPLAQEVAILTRDLPDAVVMIDDFEVPGLPDYEFDDYGADSVLSIDLIADRLPQDTVLFYPGWSRDQLADVRRGFVILARGSQAATVEGCAEGLTRMSVAEALTAQLRANRRLLRSLAPDLNKSTEAVAAARSAVMLLPRAREEFAEKAREGAALDVAIRALQDDCAQLRQQLDAVRERESAWQAERESVLAQYAQVRSQHAFLASEIKVLHSKNQFLDDDRARLEKQVTQQRAEQENAERCSQDQLKELSGLLEDARRHIRSVEQSTLWRSTRWLVALVEFTRRRPAVSRRISVLRRRLIPDGSRRAMVYGFALQPLVRRCFRDATPVMAASGEAVIPMAEPIRQHAHAPDPSLQSPDITLGPLRFVPHDGGFFSNFNFIVGEMVIGRQVYPVFSYQELMGNGGKAKHFAYFAEDPQQNVWFEFFEPVRYAAGDELHLDSAALSGLPSCWGHIAAPEFRLPRSTMALYQREDFGHWRRAVHDAIAGRITVAADIRALIDGLLAKMPGQRIGVHVRHPSHLVEQGSVFLTDYFEVIDRLLAERPESGIFIASDNELAITAFQHRYPGNVFFHHGFIRQSVDDVLEWAYSLTQATSDDMGFVGGVGFQTHYRLAAKGGGAEGVRSGKEAVADVFTLAACQDFICTASNFTLACSYLNPDQVQHLISKGA